MRSDLVGKFHAHITLGTDDTNFVCPSGWKTTIILLSKNDRHQKDIMITRHFHTNGSKTPTMAHMLKEIEEATGNLTKQGHEVIRQKLEHESLPTVAPSRDNYRECHVKMKIPKGVELQTVPNFVKSSNPMQVTDEYITTFLNARFYQGSVDRVDQLIDVYVKMIEIKNPECEVMEVKKESTVYDTNLSLDKWWA